LLTAKQKLARVRLAKAAVTRGAASWKGALITDSKYFWLYARGKPAGRWCTPDTRGTVERPKHSIAAHVYMGMSNWGITSLKFVTGTHKHPKTYISAKGGNHRGVGQEEYGEVLTDLFIPEGMQLFQQAGKWSGKWQLQQDNAPPHNTVTNMELISDSVPGGLFAAWPANSPDLSPVENLWAYMQAQLHKRYKSRNVEELKDSLEQIRQSIPASTLQA